MKDLPDICLEIENSLPLWVGGDLEPEALRAVEDHLGVCRRCAENAAKARRARTLLCEGLRREAARGGEGADPWPVVRARLFAEGWMSARTGAGAPRAFPRLGLRWSAAAAVLVALAVAWSRFSQPDDGSGTSSNTLGGNTPGASVSPRPVAADVPVVPAGLRHLSPSERRLRDSARTYGALDEAEPGWSAERLGQPVRLELPIGTPPR